LKEPESQNKRLRDGAKPAAAEARLLTAVGVGKDGRENDAGWSKEGYR
jgi:hypothetical protein